MYTPPKLPEADELTAEWLLDHFGQGSGIDPVLQPYEAHRAIDILNGASQYFPREFRSKPSRREQVFFYLNDVLGYHGVERIRSETFYDGYWAEAKYVYLNSGHTTALELYYHTQKKCWIAGTLMDLHEQDEELQK